MDKNPRIVANINIDPRGNYPRMTEQCIQYKMGNCLYGQNCRYAHVNDDHNNVAKYNNADEYRNDNVCVGPMARGEYRSSKVYIGSKCRKFWNGELCPYGQNCHFLHDEPSVTKSDNRKTRICYKWEKTGSCVYGRVCCYAHGQHELRRTRPQSNVQHEIITTSSKRSATAAPRGPYCGTANPSARDQDKKKILFNENKKLKGIYADWIDEISTMHSSLDEVGI